jgi:gamma-glutamylcyclotransferase (GGCT)/AIG2-like uncharacterized protein YtfP/predicted transcriptional regulator
MMKRLMNKVEPNHKSFQNFNKLMEECRQLLESQINGTADIEQVIGFIRELIENQDVDGYWRLIYSEDMPNDARIYHWKYPTILFTGLLINFYLTHPKECNRIEGLEAAMTKALDILEKGKLVGHGFGCFNFMIKALNLLVHAGVMQFIRVYPTIHKAFTQLIQNIKMELEKALAEGKTRFDFDEDFRLRIEDVVLKMNGEKKAWLFVYGTLMRSNSNQELLENSEFRGTGILPGYALYDLGRYPGIIEDEEAQVKGEIFCISQDKLAEIDAYEAEGYLYKRKKVKVYTKQGESIEAHAYIYNRPVENSRKIPFSFQPWYAGITDYYDQHVWYACYGSNINYERFMKYIELCQDKTPPIQVRAEKLNHPVYFSKNSSRWENKGVAFLDLSKKGSSYGRMYLITKEQLAEIQHLEGPCWYNKKALLGHEYGLPIYTLTHEPRWEQDTVPGEKYLKVIKEGIRDAYPNLSHAAIDNYLLRKILGRDHRSLLKYLRQQEHGVCIRDIANGIKMSVEGVTKNIRDLLDLNLIKQDGRSVRIGIPWDGIDAVYYTVRMKRTLIDRIVNIGVLM